MTTARTAPGRNQGDRRVRAVISLEGRKRRCRARARARHLQRRRHGPSEPSARGREVLGQHQDCACAARRGALLPPGNIHTASTLGVTLEMADFGGQKLDEEGGRRRAPARKQRGDFARALPARDRLRDEAHLRRDHAPRRADTIVTKVPIGRGSRQSRLPQRARHEPRSCAVIRHRPAELQAKVRRSAWIAVRARRSAYLVLESAPLQTRTSRRVDSRR